MLPCACVFGPGTGRVPGPRALNLGRTGGTAAGIQRAYCADMCRQFLVGRAGDAYTSDTVSDAYVLNLLADAVV